MNHDKPPQNLGAEDPELENILAAMKSPEERKAQETAARIDELLDGFEATIRQDMSSRTEHLGLSDHDAQTLPTQIIHEMRAEFKNLAYMSDPAIAQRCVDGIKEEMLEACLSYLDRWRQKELAENKDPKRIQVIESEFAQARENAKSRIGGYVKADILEILELKLKGTLDPQSAEMAILESMGANRGYNGSYHVYSQRIQIPLWSHLSLARMRGVVAHEYTHAGFHKKGSGDDFATFLAVTLHLAPETEPQRSARREEITSIANVYLMYDESFAFQVERLGNYDSSDKVPFAKYGVDTGAFKAIYNMIGVLLNKKTLEQIDRIIKRFSDYFLNEAKRAITNKLSAVDFNSAAMGKLQEIAEAEV